MAYPTIYDVEYSYSGFATGLGDGSFPGSQLDNDLAGLDAADASILAFLQGSFTSSGVLIPAALPDGATFTAYITEVADDAVAAATATSAANAALTAADVVLTHADVVLTGADVDATNADVVLTHADVVLTGADVDATNADVLLTAADVVLTNADVVLTHADVVLTGADVVAAQAIVDAIVWAQCRLVYTDASTVTLNRQDGQLLTIDGVARTIGATAPTLAVSGLTPDTTYYVYAAWSGTEITLEASATVPVAGTNGQQVKTGDATRTLVGMVNPGTGPAFLDAPEERRVLSYHNRRPRNVFSAFSTDRSTTSETFVEINSENRVRFLSWGDADERFGLNGLMTHSTTELVYSALALDAAGTQVAQAAANTTGSAALTWEPEAGTIAVGLHTLLWAGRVGAAGTGTFSALCEIRGQVRG